MGLIMLCSMAFAMPVRAEETNGPVTLRDSGDGVEIVLSQSAGEEVYSLHLSFEISTVKGNLNTEEVSFTPNEKEGVYISDPLLEKTNNSLSLDIYASSKQNLLEGQELILGTVGLEPKSGSVTAQVRVNGLETVNGVQEMEAEELQGSPVQITIGKDDSKPEVPGDDDSDNNHTGGGGNGGNSGNGGSSNTTRPGRNPNTGNERVPSVVNNNIQQAPANNGPGQVTPEDQNGNSQPPVDSQPPISNQPSVNGQPSATSRPLVSNQPASTVRRPSADRNTQGESTSPAQPATEDELTGTETAEPETVETETANEVILESESASAEDENNAAKTLEVGREQESSGIALWIKILLGAGIAVVALAGVIFAVKLSKRE